MEWEGPEAMEALEHSNAHINPVLLKTAPTEPQNQRHPEPEEVEESSDDGSEDDYVVEQSKPKGKVRA